MARKKAKPITPVYKVKPIKAKKFSVKIPKLPTFRVKGFK